MLNTPKWMSGESEGPLGLPSGPIAWIALRTLVSLGPAKRRRWVAPVVSPIAIPITWAGFFWPLELPEPLSS